MNTGKICITYEKHFGEWNWHASYVCDSIDYSINVKVDELDHYIPNEKLPNNQKTLEYIAFVSTMRLIQKTAAHFSLHFAQNLVIQIGYHLSNQYYVHKIKSKFTIEFEEPCTY